MLAIAVRELLIKNTTILRFKFDFLFFAAIYEVIITFYLNSNTSFSAAQRLGNTCFLATPEIVHYEPVSRKVKNGPMRT